jgi:hypothetical protein
MSLANVVSPPAKLLSCTAFIVSLAGCGASTPSASTLTLAVAAPIIAGTSATTLVVAATDSDGRRVPTYVSTWHVEVTGAGGKMPADYTLSGTPPASDTAPDTRDFGEATFNIVLNAGSSTITVTDTKNGSIKGSTTVVAEALQEDFQFSFDGYGVTLDSADPDAGDGNTYAGFPTGVGVTVVDQAGRAIENYTGTVAFSGDNTDDAATSHAYVADDAGTYEFQITPKDVGTITVTATDAAASATNSDETDVIAKGPVFEVILASPADQTIDALHELTIAAKDVSGRLIAGYAGTVHFTAALASGEGQASLPMDYTFVEADDSSATFNVAFFTAGDWTVTVADTETTDMSGSVDITIAP